MESSTRSAWRASIDGYKYSLLLVALLVLIVAPLIVGSSAQRSLIFGYSFLAVMLFAVLATVEHRRALLIVIGLAGLAATAQIMSFVYGTRHIPQYRIAVFAAFLSLIAVLIIRDVLRSESITWDKIQGAVCAYLLAGLAWGLLYAWVGLRDPQAFSAAAHFGEVYAGEPMIYYSFVTLTTLGYGDITPVSHPARTLSWLEAAFGQIYLVVLVARLVSLHLAQASRR
jgi:hypothetical protein